MAEAPRRARFGVVALVAAVLVAASCGGGGSRRGDAGAGGDRGRGDGTMTVEEAADFAGIELPESATDVHAHGERGIDQLVLLDITMPTDDLDGFLAASDLPPAEPGRNPVQASLGNQLGWQLDDLESFAGAEEEGPPVRQYVVDTSDAERVTVYIAAFAT